MNWTGKSEWSKPYLKGFKYGYCLAFLGKPLQLKRTYNWRSFISLSYRLSFYHGALSGYDEGVTAQKKLDVLNERMKPLKEQDAVDSKRNDS